MYTRHSQTLQFAEIRRAIQSLSTIYVQKRDRLAAGEALATAGKRTAFALFYAPLHWLTIRAVLSGLNIQAQIKTGPQKTIQLADLGCGTGVGSAAWALHQTPSHISITGYDLNPWALSEAQWNWQTLKLTGRTIKRSITRIDYTRANAYLAAFTVNELDDASRQALLVKLCTANQQGACVLVIEPISKRLTPWWATWEKAFLHQSGRSDHWQWQDALPAKLELLGHAVGLDLQNRKARSLYMPGF